MNKKPPLRQNTPIEDSVSKLPWTKSGTTYEEEAEGYGSLHSYKNSKGHLDKRTIKKKGICLGLTPEK